MVFGGLDACDLSTATRRVNSVGEFKTTSGRGTVAASRASDVGLVDALFRLDELAGAVAATHGGRKPYSVSLPFDPHRPYQSRHADFQTQRLSFSLRCFARFNVEATREPSAYYVEVQHDRAVSRCCLPPHFKPMFLNLPDKF